MIPQSAPNMYGWILVFLFVSVFLISCHSDNAELKSIEANVTLDDADSLEGETIAPITKEYSHPYLVKADEIRDKEGFEEALAYYEAAVSLFKKDGNWEGLLSAKNRISSYYSNKSYYEISYYDSLLKNLESTWELGTKHLDSSSLIFSETQYWFGKYFEETGEPYKSISFHQKALNTRVQHLSEDNLLVAESLKALGDVYFYQLSDYHNAENFYERSVDIKSRLLDSADVDLIRGYYAMARAKRLNDDTESAINYGLKALKIAMLDPTENNQRIGLCHNVLANIYSDKNDFKNAELHYQKAIEISKADSGQNKYNLPIYYNGLGSIYLDQKRFELAKSYFNKGLIINKLYFPSNFDKIATNFMSLGRAYTKLKQYDSALIYFNRSLKIKLNKFGVKDDRTAIIYEFLGDMYANNGQLQLALQHYQKALISLVKDFNENNILVNPNFSSENYGFRLVHVIIKKASLLKEYYLDVENIKFLETSLKTYLLANKIIDQKRNHDITEESRLVLIENYFQDQMENGIDCAFLLYQLTKEANYRNIAFQLIEKSKYLLLFESLIKNKNKKQLGVPDSLLRLEKNIKVEMAFFKQILDEELQSENLDQKRINELQNKVFATSIKQERLYDKLKHDYPNYYGIKFDSVTSSIDQIQKALKDKETRIISYYYGQKNIYMLGISSEKATFKRLKKSEHLENAITTYLDQISNSNDITDPTNYRLFFESSFQLYESLIAPMLASQKTGTDVIIIPHGKLSVLPFESLIQSIPNVQKVDYKNLNYLVKDYQFSYAYSANFLLKDKSKLGNKTRPRFLAFSYSGDSNNQKKKNEIIGSSREINNISKFIKGSFYKGPDATETTFKSLASQFDILHLAVHGMANNQSKLSNSLMFKNERDSVNDGILHSYELLNMDIKAKLVVLSACETGLGKQFKGEGIFSMARSFAYAGCESIIMSYWKANDNSTAEVMRFFYKYLVQGVTIDKALTIAKRAYINQGEELTSHPSTWAAFVALGDMNTPIFNNQKASTNIYWYVLLLSLFTLALILVVKRRAK